MNLINAEPENKDKSFQERPIWIFFTAVIILISATPAINDLVLDFFPNLRKYQRWVKLFAIFISFVILGAIWRKEQQKKKNQNISEDEQEKKYIRKALWRTWRQKIFKNWPLNIITFKFIPLPICWIISLFINKKYKPYGIDSFKFPKDREDYKEKIKKYYEIMFRIHILNPFRSYEVKFGRDFQHIEIRWTNANERNFNKPKNELYEKFFSGDNLKHIKIFTWIFPFGLYWNLRRILLKVT